MFLHPGLIKLITIQDATHFIEVVKAGRIGVLNYPMNPIKMKERNLNITKQSQTLKTVAVWFIKPKVPDGFVRINPNEINTIS